MLKHTARFACLALLMFAAGAIPQTINLAQLDSPLPMPDPQPPITHVNIANLGTEDSPLPMPDPQPPITHVNIASLRTGAVEQEDSPLPMPDPKPPITQVT
jgi:hypothetical protein